MHGRQKSINFEVIIAFRTVYNIFASEHRFVELILPTSMSVCVCSGGVLWCSAVYARTHARTLACINSQKICNCNTVVTFSLCSLVFLFLFHSSMPFKNDKRLKFSLAPLYNTRTHTYNSKMYFGYCELLKCLCCIMYWTILWLEKSWDREKVEFGNYCDNAAVKMNNFGNKKCSIHLCMNACAMSVIVATCRLNSIE